MHWAVHGQTAAEVVVARADSSKPNMGLTTWVGERPRKADAAIAKNYLSVEQDRFAEQRRALPAPVEKHFEEAVHDVKLLEKQRSTTPRSKSRTGGAKRPRKKKR